SDTAAAAVTKMNPDLKGKIVTHQDRVGADTEVVYNDGFFDGIDAVTNALDNVEARRYMDGRCVFYRKPLLESGTLGTKGNTQVVVPFLTESYSASQDPPEKSIPSCTLKNFPNAIEHTIQWARDLFAGLFVQPAESVNAYLATPDYVNVALGQANDAAKVEALRTIQKFLVAERPRAFDDCVAWARRTFETLYNDNIRQLLYNFPADAVTSSGQLFWSPPKRAPTAVAFNPEDDLHVDFVVAAANLHAFNYGLTGSRDRQHIAQVAAAAEVEKFEPRAGVAIQVNENEAVEGEPRDADELEGIVKGLPDPAAFAGVRLEPAEFEKDDDSNFHVDFVTAASNLRAANYAIPAADRFRTKQIAGKIIPAIATTTSMVTGLVCLELYKIIGRGSGDTQRKVEDYKNGFVNLALPFVGFSEPVAPATTEYNGTQASEWDAFVFSEDLTLQELIEYFEREHKLELTMVSSGVTMLFSGFMNRKKAEARKSMKFKEIIEEAMGKEIAPHVKQVVLIVCCEDAEGEDVDVPEVRVRIRA
ncbi:E1 ubiquitin-activating protein, partial [Coemansia sp. RSA 2603]